MPDTLHCLTRDNHRLAVTAAGPADAPALLFVHGYSQSSLCWRRQFESELAQRFRMVAYDLRGHGMSAKPEGVRQYANHRTWAEDLAAVIGAAGLRRPVLVGWSFGVEVIRDYLLYHGDAALGGLVLVSGRCGPEDVGPGLLDEVPGLCSGDLGENVAATLRFVRNCAHGALDERDLLDFVAFNAMACLPARIGMRQRSPLDGEELKRIRRPTLLIHGDDDRIILPQGADKLQAAIPGAELLRYPDCGHLPFIEHCGCFNRDLAGFMERK